MSHDYEPRKCWYGIRKPDGPEPCNKPAKKYAVTREGWIRCDMWLCAYHSDKMAKGERKFTLTCICE